MKKRGQRNRFRGGFTIVELLIVVVVIAILAAITIVSYNGITNQARESVKKSDLATWKKKSEIYKAEHDIVCPANYVFVYGNPHIPGSTDFCVMKYEAKNVDGVATSTPEGAPWVSIWQSNAIAAATAVGGHVLTEVEWMTLAADVLSVKYNWSGGAVGQGVVYQGHVNSAPNAALAASHDDEDTLYGMTGNIGNASGDNSSRVLYLTSGDPIWDVSGNVYEWTQQSLTVPTMTMSQVGVSGDAAFNWREWKPGSFNVGNLPAVSRADALTAVPSLGGITNWGMENGIGRIYANYADAGNRAFLRGGHWTNTSNAGVLTLNLGYPSASTHVNAGFRVAQ